MWKGILYCKLQILVTRMALVIKLCMKHHWLDMLRELIIHGFAQKHALKHGHQPIQGRVLKPWGHELYLELSYFPLS